VRTELLVLDLGLARVKIFLMGFALILDLDRLSARVYSWDRCGWSTFSTYKRRKRTVEQVKTEPDL